MRIRSLVLLVAVAGCSQGGSSAADSAGAKDAVAALDVKLQKWIAVGQADSIVSGYYATDAVFFDANAPAARGTAAIKTAFEGMLKSGKVKLAFHMTNFRVADSLAYDEGPYTLELRSNDDTSKVLVNDHGNYVTTFVKRNGEWRAMYDIANSEVPAPPPPPAKKK
jgi:ketosteroid isomerase-like protein